MENYLTNYSKYNTINQKWLENNFFVHNFKYDTFYRNEVNTFINNHYINKYNFFMFLIINSKKKILE